MYITSASYSLTLSFYPKYASNYVFFSRFLFRSFLCHFLPADTTPQLDNVRYTTKQSFPKDITLLSSRKIINNTDLATTFWLNQSMTPCVGLRALHLCYYYYYYYYYYYILCYYVLYINSPHSMEPKGFFIAFESAHHQTPIMSQINPVHAPTSHFLKIHLKIIVSSMPGTPKVVSFLQVSPPNPCIRLSSPPYVLYAPPISFFSI